MQHPGDEGAPPEHPHPVSSSPAEASPPSAADPALAELVSAAIPRMLDALGADAADPLIAEAAAAVEPVRLAAGEMLFSAGDTPDAAYFVVTGRLLVLDDDHAPSPIRRVGHGELLGELGLLEGTPRTASIRADRDSILGRLPRRAFERLAAEHPEFLMGVTRTVVRRLAHPRPPVDGVGTVTVAVAHPEVNGRVLTARMLRALERYGPAHHLSSAAVDSTLAMPGVSQQPSGSPEAVSIDAYLDDLEAANRFVILEADRTLTPWSATALRRADRVVIVTGPEPGANEQAAVRAFADAARAGYRPEVWLAVVHPEGGGPPTGTAALARRCHADRVVHLLSDSDVARVARLVTGTGVGLVLGGGGARGFAHIGAYRALRELRVPIDAVAGASIGGVLGAGIALGLSPEALTARAAEGFRRVLDYTLPLVSVVKGARITRGIEGVFSGVDIEDLTLPFLCVSTDLTTSRQVVHRAGPVTRATRAGLAIPGVIPPVPHDGSLLVDGGVLDNLPIEALRATGLVGEIIAVDVAPPLGPRARTDFGLSISGWGALLSRFRRRRTYPPISSLLLRSMIVGSMERRDRLVAEGYADLLLAPDLRGISLLAFDRVEDVARASYEAVLPEIEDWLVRRDEAT